MNFLKFSEFEAESIISFSKIFISSPCFFFGGVMPLDVIFVGLLAGLLFGDLFPNSFFSIPVLSLAFRLDF
jgi:hypothetical protein